MLTDQQRELVENNTPLAVKKAWKWKNKLEDYSHFDLSECISMCYEGLCKAAKGYDESKGVKFSTFAYRCMDNEFYLWFKYNGRQKRGEMQDVESLFTVVRTDKDGLKTYLIDVFCATEEENDTHVLVDELMNNLNQKEIDFLTMYYLQGMTYQQIGDKMGTSYQNAQQKIRNTVKKCKKILQVS